MIRKFGRMCGPCKWFLTFRSCLQFIIKTRSSFPVFSHMGSCLLLMLKRKKSNSALHSTSMTHLESYLQLLIFGVINKYGIWDPALVVVYLESTLWHGGLIGRTGNQMCLEVCAKRKQNERLMHSGNAEIWQTITLSERADLWQYNGACACACDLHPSCWGNLLDISQTCRGKIHVACVQMSSQVQRNVPGSEKTWINENTFTLLNLANASKVW